MSANSNGRYNQTVADAEPVVLDDFEFWMNGLAALYPDYNLTPATIAQYRRLLGHIAIADLQMAADQHAAESPFFPKVADITKRLNSLRAYADDRPDVDQAWQQAQGYAADVMLRRQCQYEVRDGELVEFQPRTVHPAVQAATEAIGIERVHANENPSALFAQFRDMYGVYVQRDDFKKSLHPAVAAQLAQIAEAKRLQLPAPATLQRADPRDVPASKFETPDEAAARVQAEIAGRQARRVAVSSHLDDDALAFLNQVLGGKKS